MKIHKPYLLLVGDVTDPRNAKTAFGLRDWTREDCVGQWRFTEESVDLELPSMTPEQAVQAGAKTLVIGIAPPGGRLPSEWVSKIKEALEAGMDVASGLHEKLVDYEALLQIAEKSGRKLHDIRQNGGRKFPVASGKRRSGKRLLTVGTDCALGKKYTALAIASALEAIGQSVDFRATGQTGVLIKGEGVAIDSVIADFISGAAEALSPSSEACHWDVIEGQGSLFHPAYAGVSLGLLHGSQPDALVLCHDPRRETLFNFPDFACPSIPEAMEAYLGAGRLTNPDVRFVGISLNTSAYDDEEASKLIEETSARYGLPCIDPVRMGGLAIARVLEG